MARKRVSPRKFARKFNKTRRNSRAINSPAFVMRGGIRL